MEPQTILTIVISILGLVVAVAVPIVGFTLKQLFGRITDARVEGQAALDKAVADYKERIDASTHNTKTLLHDEERRRNEAISGVMSQVNQQYRDLKQEMHGVREDIRSLVNDK